MFEISQKQLSFKDFQHHRDNWRLFQDASVWVLFPLAIDVEFLFLEGKQPQVRYALFK